MPSHKFESDKLSAISQKTKNKVGDTRKSLEDSSSWLLGMSAQDITSIANHIKDVNSQVTQSLIDDTKKYWKAETDAYNTFINHVDKTSKRKVTNSSVYGELSGVSNTNRSTAKTSSPPPIPNDTSINNLSKGLDRHAKSFEKSTKLLTTALTALTSGLSRAVRESASIMRDRYNSVVFATGGGSQADAIYNAVAESNRDLAMELFKNGTNTISVEEFTRSFQSVTTYFKQDQKLITAMTSQVAQVAEVGMTVNTEFLKTSAYMYKQSGKNEKSIKSMSDSIYKLTTKTTVSAEDAQNISLDAIKLGETLESQILSEIKRNNPNMSKEQAEKIASETTEDWWKSYASSRTAIYDANPEFGAEQEQLLLSLIDKLSSTDYEDLANISPYTDILTGYDPYELKELMITDYDKFIEEVYKGLATATERYNPYQIKTISGLDENQIKALNNFRGDYNTLIKEYKENKSAMDDESIDSIKKAIEGQKVSAEDNLTNTMSEVVTDTIPSTLLDISDDLATIVSIVTGSSLLNTGISLLTQVPGGLPGAYNSVKSFLAGSKSGIPLPNTKIPPIPGADLADDALSGSSSLLSKIPGLSKLSGVASKEGSILGKVAPVLSIASIIGNGIQGLTGEKTYSKVFGLDNPNDMTTGQRAAGTVGSMIGGGHKGGLGNALGQAATWGAVGSLAGPVGTLVGAIGGGIAGLLGSDRIAQSIETNINGPLGRIGESLQNGGDDLVSSVVDLSTTPYNIVSDLFSGLGDMASNIPIIGGLLESGADLIATSNSKVGDTISLLGDGVQGALDLLNGTAKASDVLNTITSDLDKVLGDIPVVGSVWNGLHDLGDWLFGSDDDKKDNTKGRSGFSYGGAHPGVPNLPNIGTTKPNGDIDGPSPWIVTAGFHDWSIGYGNHDGVDYGVPIGTQVPSTTDGTVTYLTENDGTNWGGGPGKGVIITDSQGRQHWYWHLSKIGVSKGQQLKKGTLVGLSGNTGMSTGPHLHYGLKVNGSAINPNVTAPGLWGEVTGSMSSNPSSSSSAESDIKNYIVTSDGGKFRMDYNYGSGGIPSNILSGVNSKSRFMHSRNIGSAISPSSTYVSNNWTPNITNTNMTLKSDNSEVVAELRQLISLLNYKLDRLNNTISNGYKQSSVEDFSLAY